MPNLTSYHAPAIHLTRELPKTYCDLIEHEYNYMHFLRSRVANIQSSLASMNQKQCFHKISQHRYFEQKNADDCHNDNKRINISHFSIRQNRWNETVENENKRFIQSLMYENL